MSTLAKLLDRDALREMAGGRSFERGQEYFSAGCVRGLAEHDGTITAKVQGTSDYRVKLWVKDGDLEYSCTCPVGTDGDFCKHCVAAGLAWLSPTKCVSKKPGKAA
ncbi:MAG: SWIM zinc finger family protein, partial [Elusimicrobiota bacterium]